MTERIRPRRQDATFVVGSQHNIFTDSENSEGTVVVSHGPYMERLPVGNMTVGEIRMRFSDRLDIDPQSQPIVDGQEVDENTRVSIGQALTFVRKAGEKGMLASAMNLEPISKTSLRPNSALSPRLKPSTYLSIPAD